MKGSPLEVREWSEVKRAPPTFASEKQDEWRERVS